MAEFGDFDEARWEKLRKIAYFKALSITKHPFTSEEVAQEAIARFMESDEPIQRPEEWISVVARNLANNAVMRKSSIFRADQIQGFDEDLEFKPRNIKDEPVEDFTTSQIVIDRAKAQGALEALSEKEQLIIGLISDGYTNGEVAEMLGYKDATVVANLVSRIRSKAKNKLEEFN
jgi:RNA polymerase sigma factor (sigma-70 family)